MINNDVQWYIWLNIMAIYDHRFKLEQHQKELDALRIVQLCLTGK